MARVAFGVGGLAHLLKNRFYIGEVVYRGEAFRGDHEPILDPALFAAVQAKLSSQAVERRCRIRGAQALLTGRLFDEQGRHMTPTHTNKKGVRYSYYVSHAVLRKQSAKTTGRVPAPELEALVVNAVRRHFQANRQSRSRTSEPRQQMLPRCRKPERVRRFSSRSWRLRGESCFVNRLRHNRQFRPLTPRSSNEVRAVAWKGADTR